MAGYVTDVHERHTQLDLDSGWWCSRLQWKPQSNLCENKSDTVFFFMETDVLFWNPSKQHLVVNDLFKKYN